LNVPWWEDGDTYDVEKGMGLSFCGGGGSSSATAIISGVKRGTEEAADVEGDEGGNKRQKV
jgi:hypothetical protein